MEFFRTNTKISEHSKQHLKLQYNKWIAMLWVALQISSKEKRLFQKYNLKRLFNPYLTVCSQREWLDKTESLSELPDKAAKLKELWVEPGMLLVGLSLFKHWWSLIKKYLKLNRNQEYFSKFDSIYRKKRMIMQLYVNFSRLLFRKCLIVMQINIGKNYLGSCLFY